MNLSWIQVAFKSTDDVVLIELRRGDQAPCWDANQQL